METVNLLETLLRAHGPSGDEGDICQVIRREAEQYADEVAVDTMGNLIAHKKGAGPRVMLAAHMDSVGVIVTHIEKNGFLRFGALGGLEAKAYLLGLERENKG